MNPATRLPRWADAALSAWLLFWASLVVVYCHSGALAFAGLAGLLGAAGWVVLLRRTPLRGRALLVGLAWVPLLLWMAVSSLWGPEVGEPTPPKLALQLALMLSLPALVATRAPRTKTVLSHILIATALAGTLAMVADVASGYGLAFAVDPLQPGESMWHRQSDAELNLGRGLVAWSLLTPVLLALMAHHLRGWRAWAAGAALVALLLAASLLNRLVVPLLILASSLPLAALATRAPRAVGRLGVAGALGLLLGAPLVGWLAGRVPESVLAQLPLSWDHRLRMWDYTLSRILERPLLGHGMDASRAMQDSFVTRIDVPIPFISLHPHNVGLQVWLELGLFGALFAAFALVSAMGAAARVSAGSRARVFAMQGLLFGVMAASLITVGAWQYWFWGLVVFAAALVLLLPGRHTPA